MCRPTFPPSSHPWRFHPCVVTCPFGKTVSKAILWSSNKRWGMGECSHLYCQILATPTSANQNACLQAQEWAFLRSPLITPYFIHLTPHPRYGQDGTFVGIYYNCKPGLFLRPTIGFIHLYTTLPSLLSLIPLSGLASNFSCLCVSFSLQRLLVS